MFPPILLVSRCYSDVCDQSNVAGVKWAEDDGEYACIRESFPVRCTLTRRFPPFVLIPLCPYESSGWPPSDPIRLMLFHESPHPLAHVVVHPLLRTRLRAGAPLVPHIPHVMCSASPPLSLPPHTHTHGSSNRRPCTTPLWKGMRRCADCSFRRMLPWTPGMRRVGGADATFVFP